MKYSDGESDMKMPSHKVPAQGQKYDGATPCPYLCVLAYFVMTNIPTQRVDAIQCEAATHLGSAFASVNRVNQCRGR